MTDEEKQSFQNTIMEYYRLYGRSFPWRETNDAYEITVSEIMLQQTQTERVVPKYKEWLRRFPSASSLADASLSDVLAAWSGLGYNRRGRFLQEACRIVCEKYDGVFPADVQALDALPGIGPYTARAIATFAFGMPEVFIETNIRAVYIFFFFHEQSNVSDKALLSLIEDTLMSDNPRIWYYALMDYGAELKKKVQNPNRKSAHYTKQSRFEGSLRQARGAVLRQLVREKHGAAVTLESISQTENIDYDRIKAAAEALLAENMIISAGGGYVIRD